MAHWTKNQFRQDIFSYQGLKYLNNLGLPWLMVIYPQHLYVYVQRVNHALSFQIGNDKIMKMHLFMFKLLVNQMLVKTNCLALTFKIVAS